MANIDGNFCFALDYSSSGCFSICHKAKDNLVITSLVSRGDCLSIYFTDWLL
jgi:hypothetical protein